MARSLRPYTVAPRAVDLGAQGHRRGHASPREVERWITFNQSADHAVDGPGYLHCTFGSHSRGPAILQRLHVEGNPTESLLWKAGQETIVSYQMWILADDLRVTEDGGRRNRLVLNVPPGCISDREVPGAAPLPVGPTQSVYDRYELCPTRMFTIEEPRAKSVVLPGNLPVLLPLFRLNSPSARPVCSLSPGRAHTSPSAGSYCLCSD